MPVQERVLCACARRHSLVYEVRLGRWCLLGLCRVPEKLYGKRNSVHKPSGAGTECNVRARLCQRVGVLYCTTLNIPPGRAEESEALRREGSTRDASRGRRAERDSQTVETERAGVRYGL